MEEDKAESVWLFVRVFALGMRMGNAFTGLKRPLPTDADECYWIFPWMFVFLNVCVCSFTCRWINPLGLKKKSNQTWTEELLEMTDGDDHSLWRKAYVGPLTKMPWCLHYTLSHKPALPLSLCFHSAIYIHMYQRAGIFVLPRRTLGRFSPQWPLILSCKAWCRCYMEYWVNQV